MNATNYFFPESGFVRLPQIIGDRKRGIIGPVPVSARRQLLLGTDDNYFCASTSASAM